MLEQQAFRFTLAEDHTFSKEADETWKAWLEGSQYVGLAEVHNSKQLSFFTAALLNTLNDIEYANFALELGPNSIKTLISSGNNERNLGERIKAINQRYGKKSIYKTPLIFINKEADAIFMNRAEALSYKFWGLDQEYAYSYAMLVDRIYELYPDPTNDQTSIYQQAKALLQKNIYKDKIDGQPVYCWYQNNEILSQFINDFAGKSSVDQIIADIQESWDIYCKSATGKGSNQQRADYMKKNFDNFLAQDDTQKVFVKMGGVHLTHGKSPFGVNDLGLYLHKKAKANNSEFVSIRHLITYRNGKSNIGKSGWKSVTMFLELGRKDQWTAVDLRPFRKQLQDGAITTTDKYRYEIMSYDILLISPDDQYDKANY